MKKSVVFPSLICAILCSSILEFRAFAHIVPILKKNREDNDRYHPTRENSRASLRKVEDVDFWTKDAQHRLQLKKEEFRKRIENEAKNVILFLGDGMGMATVTASRIFKGQQEGLQFGGEEAEFHFETFPNTAFSKTYCANGQVADSACSSTAYLGGVKGNIETIGVTSDVKWKDCVAQMNPANHVSSILHWAQKAGKSTGIVTTTRVTHASPAGTYAHIANRNWEDDDEIEWTGGDSNTCDDIAEQLILQEPGKYINVILGGGRRALLNSTIQDPESGFGKRKDGKNLVQDWLNDKEKEGKNPHYIYSRDQLLSLDTTNVDFLLGLFSPTHLAYQTDPAPRDDDPTLSEMTQVAINILSKNPNGFFLFVEGGRIDHAHHDNFAQRAFVETIEFDKSVKLADDLTNDLDTLIVVTADHSHVMTISGYPDRGNPILDISKAVDWPDIPIYPTISYANGPSETPLYENCEPRNITGDPFYDLNYQQLAMIYIDSETHGGEDVPIYAKGPFAHYFSGVQQQSFIPHLMSYASCIGTGATYCDDIKSNSGSNLGLFSSVLIICAMLLNFT